MKRTEVPRPILRGQMWWANIPRDSCSPHSQHGIRPIVVISNDGGNAHSPTLLVCPLTTQKDKYYYIHPNVMCNDTLSYVLCEQIRVLDKELLGKYIGKVREVEQDYIDRALALSIGLPAIKTAADEESRCAELAAVTSTKHMLEEKVAELEKEIAKYKAQEEMTQLGIHVKGVVDILFKPTISPVSQPVTEVAQNIMEEVIEPVSEPDAKEVKVDTELSEEYIKPKKITHLSAIDKFNKRYEKYQQLQSASKSSSDTNKQLETELARPHATKWNDESIRSFLEDYPNLSEDELLAKYKLKSYATAGKYYCKFKKHESL